MKNRHPRQAMALLLTGSLPLMAQAETTTAPEPAIEQAVVNIHASQADAILPGVSRSASKLDLDIHETPQAISVVPQALIESQAALSTGDMLKNVSGVTYSGGEGRRDQFYVRGFDARRDTLVDGFRDDSLYYRDPVNTESIEVLKGPSSVTYGRSGGGGMINRVSKKPVDERIASARFIAGTDDLYRAELDMGDSLSDDMSYRLTTAVEDSGSFRDFVTSERYSINPSIKWQVNEQTSVLAQLEYLNQDRTPDRGIPGVDGKPADVDISNYYGEHYDFSSNEVINLRLVLDHAFSENLRLSSAVLASNAELDAINTRANGLTDSGDVRRRSFKFPQEQRNLMLVNDLTLTTRTGAIEHQIVAGAELSHQERDLFVDSLYIEDANLQNPQFTYPTVTFDTPNIDHTFTGKTAAVYLQDLIRLNNQWQVLAGLRYDHYKQKQKSHLNGSQVDRSDESISPRLGVVYQPNDAQMFYGSASQSFRPLGQKLFEFRDYNWDQKPQESIQYEVGMKQKLMDGNASLNVALFSLTKKNVATADPAEEARFVQTGKQRAQGLELDFVGQITPAWQLFANATLMDTEVVEDNTFPEGNHLEKAAEKSAGIWSDYTLNNGITLGVGAFYVGERYSDLNNRVRLPSYTRLDASVGYTTPGYDLRLNIENLTDETYYAEVNSKDRITPGAPLSARISYTLRF